MYRNVKVFLFKDSLLLELYFLWDIKSSSDILYRFIEMSYRVRHEAKGSHSNPVSNGPICRLSKCRISQKLYAFSSSRKYSVEFQTKYMCSSIDRNFNKKL